MMKKVLTLLYLLGSVLVASAQDNDSFYKNSTALGGELTLQGTWQVDVSYHRMFTPYVGVGASVGMWKQVSYDGVPEGNGWIVSSDYREAEDFFLRPSLRLVSPTILKIADAKLKLFAEPGFMMNIPLGNVFVDLLGNYNTTKDVVNVHTSKGTWYAFDCKLGLSVDVGDMSIWTGYKFSTLDTYAMRRNLVYDNVRFNDFYPKKKCMHGVFLAVSYNF